MSFSQNHFLFTSESVTEGHPDKLADQISDAVLDAYLQQDPHSRVACETLVAHDWIVLAGEITSQAHLSKEDLSALVRQTVISKGYAPSVTGEGPGFDGTRCRVSLALSRQSPDIAQAVNADQKTGKALGAGDQGLVFGYAVREAETFMPWSIHWAHRLAERLSWVRRSEKIPGLYPDGKTQVTVEYENGQVKRVATIVVSVHHSRLLSSQQIQEGIREEVIRPVIPARYLDEKTRYWINPAGVFWVGGPVADTGLTGRKIIVDTYGGHGAHGGGAFSGKDASKVDRSGAYGARWIAKNLVAAGWVDRCLVQVAYVIGASEPVSVFVQGFGTEKKDLQKIEKVIREAFPLQPGDLIQRLQLTQPIYQQTAAFGHFGRPQFAWEREWLEWA